MRFKQFINEGRSVELSLEKTIKLLKQHCTQAVKAYKNNNKIYRGVNVWDEHPFRFIDPKKFKRKSRNTTNHYTEIIDNISVWKRYPKRSQSIICSTSYGTAKAFGYTLYSVFPYDNSKIGVCPANDLWSSFPIIRKNGIYDMEMFNRELIRVMKYYTDENLPSDWKKMKDVFRKFDFIMENEDKRESLYISELLFKRYYKGDMIQFLNIILHPNKNGFELKKIGDQLPENKEVWTDGESILISYHEVINNDNIRDILF